MKPKGFPGFKGDIVLPWDPAYNEARQEWNRRIDKFPRVIAYCESRDDVSRCIRWARQRGMPLRIRSGGHHYEGYSIGNGVLVIDLSRMNAVRAEGGHVYVQGGAANYAMGGAIARRRPGETAFFYRNSRYIAGFQTIWEKDAAAEANIDWVSQNYPYLASVTAGSFVNFPYSNLEYYMRAYYGGNASRLRRVKRLYDPCNAFRFPQSIRFDER